MGDECRKRWVSYDESCSDDDRKFLAGLLRKHGELQDFEFWGKAFINCREARENCIEFTDRQLGDLDLAGTRIFFKHRYSIRNPLPKSGDDKKLKPDPSSKHIGTVLRSVLKDGREVWIHGRLQKNLLDAPNESRLRLMLKAREVLSLSICYCLEGGADGINKYSVHIPEVSICRRGLIQGTTVLAFCASCMEEGECQKSGEMSVDADGKNADAAQLPEGREGRQPDRERKSETDNEEAVPEAENEDKNTGGKEVQKDAETSQQTGDGTPARHQEREPDAGSLKRSFDEIMKAVRRLENRAQDGTRTGDVPAPNSGREDRSEVTEIKQQVLSLQKVVREMQDTHERAARTVQVKTIKERAAELGMNPSALQISDESSTYLSGMSDALDAMEEVRKKARSNQRSNSSKNERLARSVLEQTKRVGDEIVSGESKRLRKEDDSASGGRFQERITVKASTDGPKQNESDGLIKNMLETGNLFLGSYFSDGHLLETAGLQPAGS